MDHHVAGLLQKSGRIGHCLLLHEHGQIIPRAVEFAGAGDAGGGDLVILLQLIQAGGNIKVHCLAYRIVLCGAVQGEDA